MNDLKEKVLKTLTGCILLLILIGGLVMMYPNYRRAESLKRQNAELQQTIDRKKKEIAELVEKAAYSVENKKDFNLEDILYTDKAARQAVLNNI
jgi:hypothetical protein